MNCEISSAPSFLAGKLACMRIALVALLMGLSTPNAYAQDNAVEKGKTVDNENAGDEADVAPGPAGRASSVQAKASYGIGLNLGSRLHADSVEVDVEQLIQGLRDGFGDKKPAFTPEQLQPALAQFEKDQQLRAANRASQAGTKNKKEGDAYLVANKKKDGVKVTKSGLQYKVLAQGNGARPKLTDKVQTNYRGTFINGKEFDSSNKHGGPATFPVNRVIAGWTEALQMMNVGSKMQIVVPGDLAYGERGTPDGAIGPNATLIFELELLAIDKEDQGEPAEQ